jgi:CrcB protein
VNTFLIFIGAGIGGVLRYWISYSIYHLFGRQFPSGTLVVNVSGCLLIGFLFVLLLDRFVGAGPQLRSLLLVGLLGGYTTFSSFSFETISLMENGMWLSAILNIVLSVFLCLAATWLGLLLGRQL